MSNPNLSGKDLARRLVWDERHSSVAPIEDHHPHRVLVDEIAGLPPGRALDLGTGDGTNAIWLARRGWQVTAVDFSPVALDKGRAAAEAAGVRVDWKEADLLEYRPRVRWFDLVILLFIHLPANERRAVYARAAGAVAVGGTLLVIGHDRTNLAEGIGGPQDPTVLFTPDEIAAELPGLTVEKAVVLRRRATDGGPIDALVRATRHSGLQAG